MAINYTCQCGKQFRFKDEYAGNRVACPACKQEIEIPLPTALTQIQLDQDDDPSVAPLLDPPPLPRGSPPIAPRSAGPASPFMMLLGITRFFQWALGILLVVFWLVQFFIERHPPSRADGEWAYQTFLFLLLIFTLECGFSRVVRAIRETRLAAD